MKACSITRVLASCLSVVSYILLTSGFITPGATINLMVQVLLVPFALHSKAYDMITLSAVFGVINLQTLVTQLL